MKQNCEVLFRDYEEVTEESMCLKVVTGFSRGKKVECIPLSKNNPGWDADNSQNEKYAASLC